DKKGRTVLLQTLCKTSILASDVRDPPRGFPCWTLNFCLYKPCAMCLSWLHFQPCAGSEPDYNCCLSNKCTYMQLRSPEVTRVNFHLSYQHRLTRKILTIHDCVGMFALPCPIVGIVFTATFILWVHS